MRQRRRALSGPPGGLHAAFQVAAALAIAAPVAATVSELAERPSASTLAIIELTGVWALAASLAWVLRVAALSACGRWGARTRERVRDAGRRTGESR